MRRIASASLKVPWALHVPTGRLLSPAEAKEVRNLHCPDPACNSRLSLHAGDVVVHHFAHLDEQRCSLESVEHAAAKLRIKNIVDDFVAGGARPSILRLCPVCRVRAWYPVTTQVRSAELEAPLGSLRPDVLLRGPDSQPLCAIEVLWTHAVDDGKAQAFTIPWMELRAEDVLREPLRWHPSRDGLSPPRCTCESIPDLDDEDRYVDLSFEPRREARTLEWHLRAVPSPRGRVLEHDYNFSTKEQAFEVITRVLESACARSKGASTSFEVALTSPTHVLEGVWCDGAWLKTWSRGRWWGPTFRGR